MNNKIIKTASIFSALRAFPPLSGPPSRSGSSSRRPLSQLPRQSSNWAPLGRATFPIMKTSLCASTDTEKPWTETETDDGGILGLVDVRKAFASVSLAPLSSAILTTEDLLVAAVPVSSLVSLEPMKERGVDESLWECVQGKESSIYSNNCDDLRPLLEISPAPSQSLAAGVALSCKGDSQILFDAPLSQSTLSASTSVSSSLDGLAPKDPLTSSLSLVSTFSILFGVAALFHDAHSFQGFPELPLPSSNSFGPSTLTSTPPPIHRNALLSLESSGPAWSATARLSRLLNDDPSPPEQRSQYPAATAMANSVSSPLYSSAYDASLEAIVKSPVIEDRIDYEDKPWNLHEDERWIPRAEEERSPTTARKLDLTREEEKDDFFGVSGAKEPYAIACEEHKLGVFVPAPEGNMMDSLRQSLRELDEEDERPELNGVKPPEGFTALDDVDVVMEDTENVKAANIVQGIKNTKDVEAAIEVVGVAEAEAGAVKVSVSGKAREDLALFPARTPKWRSTASRVQVDVIVKSTPRRAHVNFDTGNKLPGSPSHTPLGEPPRFTTRLTFGIIETENKDLHSTSHTPPGTPPSFNEWHAFRIVDGQDNMAFSPPHTPPGSPPELAQQAFGIFGREYEAFESLSHTPPGSPPKTRKNKPIKLLNRPLPARLQTSAAAVVDGVFLLNSGPSNESNDQSFLDHLLRTLPRVKRHGGRRSRNPHPVRQATEVEQPTDRPALPSWRLVSEPEPNVALNITQDSTYVGLDKHPKIGPPVQQPLDALGLPPPQLFKISAADFARLALPTPPQLKAFTNDVPSPRDILRELSETADDYDLSTTSKSGDSDVPTSVILPPVAGHGLLPPNDLMSVQQSKDCSSSDETEVAAVATLEAKPPVKNPDEVPVEDVKMASPLSSVEDLVRHLLVTPGRTPLKDKMEVDGEDDPRHRTFFPKLPTGFLLSDKPLYPESATALGNVKPAEPFVLPPLSQTFLNVSRPTFPTPAENEGGFYACCSMRARHATADILCPCQLRKSSEPMMVDPPSTEPTESSDVDMLSASTIEESSSDPDTMDWIPTEVYLAGEF
ncbi:hypothetical protein NEOLEDRAFT_1188423 [Neolentinus lepideus HHB14362 ss-1]|uniref:Uncharacterized protein n=1 Tax=Neolentinus lepideus HHB14362 ss-1 TaxID=1314782 RepID=A0A165UAE3_9AGAM|nr:hypothetical protein NEOLEDRAFT_1188423 [Neolentinus lepideus HHB14362 ss-1]